MPDFIHHALVDAHIVTEEVYRAKARDLLEQIKALHGAQAAAAQRGDTAGATALEEQVGHLRQQAVFLLLSNAAGEGC